MTKTPNKQECCEKCRQEPPEKKLSEEFGFSYVCNDPSCPCHKEQEVCGVFMGMNSGVSGPGRKYCQNKKPCKEHDSMTQEEAIAHIEEATGTKASSPQPSDWESRNLAEWLHDKYEKYAIIVGWDTQKITKVPFADLPESNKRVMLLMADDIRTLLREELEWVLNYRVDGLPTLHRIIRDRLSKL